MKSRLFKLFGLLAIGLAAANMSSCKDPDTDGKDDGIPRVMSMRIASHEGNTITSCLVSPTDTTVMINVELDKGSAANLVVKLGVSLDLVAEYNETHGTSYTMLPVSAYEFSTQQAILPRYNTQSSSAEIRLMSGKLSDTDIYMLPVTVSKIEGSDNIGMAENAKAAYIIFSKADVPELQFVELTGLTLTTEIGEGKHNWFAAYQEPHTFSVADAAPYSELMDFVLIRHAASDFRFYGPQMGANNYGAAYDERMAPYTAGFRYLPFTGIGSKVHTKAEYDGVNSYEELLSLVNYYQNLTSGAYKYITGLDRMQGFASIQSNINNAGIFTYGAMMNGKGFGMYLVTGAQQDGEHCTLTFNVKYFEQNFRTEYNSLAMKTQDIDEPTSWEASMRADGADAGSVTKTLLSGEESTVNFSVKLDNKAPSALTATFKIDESLVAAYNTANGTSYAVVPAAAYEFATTTTAIAQGATESGQVGLKLLPDNLPDTETYLLPVALESVTGNSGVTINADKKVCYILFTRLEVEPQFIELKDITLTTEIGEGKHNWFSAYKTPHVFSVTEAAQYSEMMDFVLMRHSASDLRFYGPQMGANNYGQAYDDRMAPYTAGFQYLGFMGLGNKTHTQAEYDGLDSYDDLLDLIDYYANLPSGSYNYMTKLDRMQSFINIQNFVNSGGIFAYGKMLDCRGFGMFFITDVKQEGEHFTITFNVKISERDFRTEFNSMAMKIVE